MPRTPYYTRVLIINAAAVPRVAWRRGRAGCHFEAVLKSARRVMYKLPQMKSARDMLHALDLYSRGRRTRVVMLGLARRLRTTQKTLALAPLGQ